MKGLRSLLRAMHPRTLQRNAARIDTLAGTVKTLRREVRSAREAVDDLMRQLGSVQRHLEQLDALRIADEDAPARLDALEPVLDFDRVAAHIRAAVHQAAVAEDPAPHAIVPNVLPADLYAAVLEAVPPDLFLEARGDTARELPVPPRLAPMSSVATWIFVADVVRRVLAPALLERFQEGVNRRIAALRAAGPGAVAAAAWLTLSQGRVVLRRPGWNDPGDGSRPWDILTVVLHLARPGDGEAYGSCLAHLEVPYRANALLAVIGSSVAHRYSTIAADAPEGVRRYSYEFRIGPDRAAREDLLAAADEATRREWQAFD